MKCPFQFREHTVRAMARGGTDATVREFLDCCGTNCAAYAPEKTYGRGSITVPEKCRLIDYDAAPAHRPAPIYPDAEAIKDKTIERFGSNASV